MKTKFFFLNSTKSVAASLLVTVMVFGLTACSDTTDNPVNPPTDSEITVYTDNIDKSVRPGDDFYMYCIGSWWQRT
jgi:hypothetical protein